jgi:orotate phosphoribosyltransferase
MFKRNNSKNEKNRKNERNNTLSELINCFYNTNVIKIADTDEYTLKSGEKSNIYVDFRRLTSFPSLLKSVCKELNNNVSAMLVKSCYDGSKEKSGLRSRLRRIQKSKSLPNSSNYAFNERSHTPKTHIVGVPTGGISIAQTLSVQYDYSCLQLRETVKTHGLKRQLEGDWERGDRVILVDDVITSGTSLLECITKLENIGVIVLKVVVLLCRNSEGIRHVWNKKHIRVEHLFDMVDITRQKRNIELSHEFTNIGENSTLMECPF